MSLLDLFIIAVGLSMDAFAASVCKGLSVEKLKPRHLLVTGLYFGGFQALMPLVGYVLGKQFERYITSVDHWIAFVLLCIIGVGMILESRHPAEKQNASFGIASMLPMAIATSIDALAVGVSFAFLQIDIVPAVSFIGATTFALSAVGVKIGNLFGARYKSKAELVGGIILVAMGVKILLEHLGVFGG